MEKDFLSEEWLLALGRGNPEKERNFNDEIERAFWVKMAPDFTEKNNLNHDTPLLAETILSFIEEGSSVIEIGPGTGNFTVLMAKKAGYIIGIDFSEAMLAELEKRLEAEGIENVGAVCGKWEDAELTAPSDYIVSVNSLYRVREIRKAVGKMKKFAKKGILILRTIQRSFFYELYTSLGISAAEQKDYRLLPLFFWEQDMHCDVRFMKYKKKREFPDIENALEEIRKELGSEFPRYEKTIREKLLRLATPSEKGIEIRQWRETVAVSYKK